MQLEISFAAYLRLEESVQVNITLKKWAQLSSYKVLRRKPRLIDGSPDLIEKRLSENVMMLPAESTIAAKAPFFSA